MMNPIDEESYDGYGSDGYGPDGYGPTSFERTYRCYSLSSAGKEDLESGNRILMPMSAIETLASIMRISYPLNFEIKNPSAKTASHCGVLEFTADEGTVLLPCWMMQNLLVQEGDIVMMKNATLPKATFMKMQPHTTTFLDISNPKETLEKALGSYSCLTKGDSIMITVNKENYYIDIAETKPSRAVSMLETDCEIDFLPPLDYKEPEKSAASALSKKATGLEKSDISKFMHMGIGRRLDGKPSTVSFQSASSPQHASCSSMDFAPSGASPSQPSPKKAKISHPSERAAFNSNSRDTRVGTGSSKAPVLEKPSFMSMGIAKRLDGKPSELLPSSTLSTPRVPQHVCCSSSGPSASKPSLKKENTSHSGGIVFGPNGYDTHGEPRKSAALPTPGKAPVLKDPKISTFMDMGIPRRLDRKPSQLSFSSASSDGQRSFRPGSTRNLASQPPLEKEKMPHLSGGLAFGSNRQETFEEHQKPGPLTSPSKTPVLKNPDSSMFLGMGMGKRLDGKPSQLSFPPSLPCHSEPQQVLRSASTNNPTSSPSFDKEVSQHSKGLPLGFNRADSPKDSITQKLPKLEATEFKPFTGKSYILNGCSKHDKSEEISC